MKYENVCSATFTSRSNRFIAECIVSGETVTTHVKNTGRCKELLVPGATVYLDEPTGKARRTKYDLVAVKKEREGKSPLLINLDSSAPNEAVAEWLPTSGLLPDGALIKREYTEGKSRFDFYAERGGKRFFIDHGCGVVIGETTVIGDNVSLYHGVTLGALKKPSENKGVKRHPTILDNVTIYSNASILGGETIIGKGSTIGCNVIVTESVLPNSIITINSNNN